ncbi:RidA family protein [Acinetobacter sp. YT-02]|uniref:RidA family protein n=1 Tax=Acinetobacter sp. YT-02 TaxID=2018564 RepID=UPI0018D4F6DC|nr:RidA family protein [Acinetobacter sp. YT-02]
MANSLAVGQPIIPESMRELYTDYHYSPAYEAGGFLFISGQIGLDEHGEAPEEPAEQARLAFEGMREVLHAAGLDFTDLVSLTSHHIGVDSMLEWFPQVKDTFVKEPYPAWTALGVAGLAIPGLVVEIAGIARCRV